jgi:hypothetical protein
MWLGGAVRDAGAPRALAQGDGLGPAAREHELGHGIEESAAQRTVMVAAPRLAGDGGAGCGGGALHGRKMARRN